MMRILKISGIVFCFLFPMYLFGIEIRIDLHQAKKVKPIQYGFHYEEIGMMGDGGLYAELIRNRGFEEANFPKGLVIQDGFYQNVHNLGGKKRAAYQIDPLIGWFSVPLAYSPVRIERTAQQPLNRQNPHSMLVQITDDIGKYEKAAIYNTGYYGMAFRQGEKYKFSFYARSSDDIAPLLVRLTDENGETVAIPVTVKLEKNSWVKYAGVLVAEKNVKRGMFSIVPTGAGSFQLDMVSLFPAATWADGKSVFRKDIMQNLVDYAPDFLRFPGGCIVHGATEESMYHWKETIGDIAGRPGGWSKWLPAHRTDGIGYHEFYELCEYLGADAMYVVSTGMVCSEFVYRDSNRRFLHQEVDLDYYIRDALDAIEYAVGDTTSVWGAKRARNGHPKPFPLKYVEIGNEDFGPVYYERYEKMYRAIKGKYPQLTLIANSIIGKKEDDKRKYLPGFVEPKHIEVFDEHYYHSAPWAVENYEKFDRYDRKGPSLFIGELGLGGKYPTGVLAEGIVKLSLERNGDLNPLMADRPLMRNWDFVQREYVPSLLLHTTDASVKTLKYHVCKLFRENKIDRYYKTIVEKKEAGSVFSTAGRDPENGDLIVKIINLSGQRQKTKISIPELKNGYETTITALVVPSGGIVTPETPDAVQLVSDKKQIRFPLELDIEPYSFLVYRIPLSKR